LPDADPRKHLTLDGRVDYLIEKGYAIDGAVSDGVRRLLASMNFHYFLGYARNFRALVNGGKISGDTSLDRLLTVIRLDREFSAALFAGIADLEWLLRSALVEAHCDMHPPRACYLNEDHYRVLNIDGPPTHVMVRDQTLRSREPYVVEQYETAARRSLAASEIERLPAEVKDQVLATLPIWAVVDSWTLGLLGRIVMASKSCAGREEEFLWKNVASSFEVSNTMFPTQLQGLVVLRNQVAHHVRLWMRPTSASPKLPKDYSKIARESQSKSMYVGVLALASFLRLNGKDKAFIARVDSIVDADPAFAHGIRRPLLIGS